MSIECIGIDFGTTNTCVSVKENGKVRVLNIDPTSSQSELIRTLIFIPNRKECFFGKTAIDQYFERGMEGRFFQSIKKLLPNPEFTGTSVFGIRMNVEALVARFLSELKSRIEHEIGSIENIPVHMGRPAKYSLDVKKENLAVARFLKAIEMAGFKNVRLIDEPTAAANNASSTLKDDTLVLVCDLGGGTSDFTLFKSRTKGPINTISVHGVPVAGDSLDSDFFKENLNVYFGSEVQYQRPFSSNILTLPTSFIRILPKWHHHSFLKERSTWNFILSLRNELVDEKQRVLLENLISLVEENLGYMLHQEVEKTKVQLSKSTQADFVFKSHPIAIQFVSQLEHYVRTIEPSVCEIENAAIETLKIVDCDPASVQVIQYTGGTSKVPAIRARIEKLFPNAKAVDSEAFTAVSEGLAIAPVV